MQFPSAEVFNPGGFPVYNYIPRIQYKLEDRLRYYLESGSKILSLTGPSKSGKTVLCRKLIPNDQGIWVSGGEIREENDFWMNILYTLDIYNKVKESLNSYVNKNISSDLGGELSANVSSNFNLSTGEANIYRSVIGTSDSWKDFYYSANLRKFAFAELKNKMLPIIVDDFHYIPKDVQINIVRSLKNAVYDGQRVILISVPHGDDDPDKIEHEMTGRIQQLRIPPWEKDELKEIAYQGFKFLNVKLDDFVYDDLATESFGNPQLMQEFCRYLCYSHGIKETLPINSVYPITLENDFFIRINEMMVSKSVYDLLSRGPRHRTDRKQRKLNTGEYGDIYKAIILAIANTGPKIELSYNELSNELKNVLCGELPNKQGIISVLKKMEDTASNQRMRILEWDQETYTLHLVDPYFAYYLKWAVRENHYKCD